MTKFRYRKKKYLPISEAYERFADGKELIQALADGSIFAEGEYQSDHDIILEDEGIVASSDDGTSNATQYKIIDTHTWLTYHFDLKDFTLSKSFSTRKGDSGFYKYYNIRVKEIDLENINDAKENSAVKGAGGPTPKINWNRFWTEFAILLVRRGMDTSKPFNERFPEKDMQAWQDTLVSYLPIMNGIEAYGDSMPGPEEILDMLGEDSPEIENMSDDTIRKRLQIVFDEIQAIKKRQAS